MLWLISVVNSYCCYAGDLSFSGEMRGDWISKGRITSSSMILSISSRLHLKLKFLSIPLLGLGFAIFYAAGLDCIILMR
jgi:hypothetical protein